MAGRKNQLISANSLLPSCPGPKLGAFVHKNAVIEWGRRLDVSRTESSGTQASVFEVRIESKAYALKVVSKHQLENSTSTIDMRPSSSSFSTLLICSTIGGRY